jgi:hypothetical protein
MEPNFEQLVKTYKASLELGGEAFAISVAEGQVIEIFFSAASQRAENTGNVAIDVSQFNITWALIEDSLKAMAK